MDGKQNPNHKKPAQNELISKYLESLNKGSGSVYLKSEGNKAEELSKFLSTTESQEPTTLDLFLHFSSPSSPYI